MAHTFDGVNKLIILESGTTTLSIQTLYSQWVDWVGVDDNSKYFMAFRTVGGDAISAIKSLGLTFFLCNGWKIRPQEANHRLLVNGNIYSDIAGESIFVPTLGNYNVLIETTVSNISDVNVVSTGSAVTAQDKTDIISGVLSGSMKLLDSEKIDLIEKLLETEIDVVTFREVHEIALAILAGKTSGGGSQNIIFRNIADNKNKIIANVDNVGNRHSIIIAP